MNRNPIKAFLEAKQTEDFRNNPDKMFDFPIELQNSYGYADAGWIQDVVESVSDDGMQHTLLVVVLLGDKSTIARFTKVCKAPAGSGAPNWDTLHCSYSLTSLPS